MANNIIPMLWTRITSGFPGAATDILFLILDELDELDLFNLMDTQPALAGFILWTYGMRRRWPQHVTILNNADAVDAWHAVRHRRIQRDQEKERIRWNVEQAERAIGIGAGLPARANLVRIDLEEMSQKLVRALTQRRLIMQLQREPVPRAFMGAPRANMTPSQAWNRDLAWSIRRQLAHDAENLQAAMAADERQLALYTDMMAADGSTAPTLSTIAPQPRPIHWDAVLANVQTGLRDLPPIEALVYNDAVAALRALHRLGLFNPLGYSHNGTTWLAIAVIADSVRVARYILARYTPAMLAAHVELPAVIALPANPPPMDNHVVAFARHEWPASFNAAWPRFRRAFPPGAPPNLAASFLAAPDMENLLWMVPGNVAEELRVCGVDLSTVTPAAVAGFHFLGGTPWHVAARNTNASFFDWLVAQGGMKAQINALDGANRTALEIAYRGRLGGAVGGRRIDNLVGAERLVHHGSHFYAFAKDILAGLPEPRGDAWLRAGRGGEECGWGRGESAVAGEACEAREDLDSLVGRGEWGGEGEFGSQTVGSEEAGGGGGGAGVVFADVSAAGTAGGGEWEGGSDAVWAKESGEEELSRVSVRVRVRVDDRVLGMVVDDGSNAAGYGSLELHHLINESSLTSRRTYLTLKRASTWKQQCLGHCMDWPS
ncbi:uncharacterized protein DSM5745_09915 [Aspergillus mulundensis]|uniref:Uncharacterized protein n=1 Tax=Aspergillus mulundensis TaxID=1810919 RepID=A0A3D8QSN1_9EURO|nr:hypothetical protein DSM5745_09915 [Aspergillus mulundensis]RDW64504.1 hypothetical protein DSM5745_09915 [Aspergillus mulundensis]